ncbi:YbjQ family protein [Acidithiobacillus ferrooxidans]|uniref:YbjQ family protein n=1 Tax=Acidithiobacillus ferrooxidans TaxID=920 RepID=UPI001C067D27|nr:YbjQ family protein [Acidithiobacillus ferrooxidans]MBU2773261.1 YbjQ family protein [Acidithiobacillus ferrooxidans]
MSNSRVSVLILTTNDCPGMRVIRVLGPVYGTSVRSRNIVGNFMGGIRAVFGGKQSGYLKMIAQTRDETLAQLADHAQSLGTNAVLAMRFDSGEFDAGQGQAMNEVMAYGTAVVVEGL